MGELIQLKGPLTEQENIIKYSTLIYKPAPPLTDEVRDKLLYPNITPLPISEKNRLLSDVELQNEIGFCQLASGGWLVAMKSEMPGVTREMVEWWFWWHAQEPLRYKIWFPGEHIGISVAKRDSDYFDSPFTGFRSNTQYPVEQIGKTTANLYIDFLSPMQFGFDKDIFQPNRIETVVCGNVGLAAFNIEHTKMAHIFKQSSDGLTIISRFWMGESLRFMNMNDRSLVNRIAGSRLVRQQFFHRRRAFEMAEHCSREYRNLAIILPDLYSQYGN